MSSDKLNWIHISFDEHFLDCKNFIDLTTSYYCLKYTSIFANNEMSAKPID